MDAKPGDFVEVTTKDEKVKGTLMPSSTGSIIVKLDSGYNVGIDQKNVKEIKVLEKLKSEKAPEHNMPEAKGLPTITILHTGGTIASKVDYKTGAVVAKVTPEEIVRTIPELRNIANFRSVFVSNLQSESMRFGHYNLMAKAIDEELKKNRPKGIIITHGTDTLHYSAAALSFILENVDIPVILVGAQRSSDRGSSDAAINLISAARFIAHSDFKGIAICMHASTSDDKCNILPGTKARKMHTSRRDAFKAVNANPIAQVDYETGKINWIDKNYHEPAGPFKLRLIDEKVKVGIIKTHTHTQPEDIAYFSNHKGLIVEGTGLGHSATTAFDEISKINEKNKAELAKIAKKGVVALTSQCIFGRVNMNVYSPQKELLEIGVIPGLDMTTETAFIKLAWLLSNYPVDEARNMMTQNLRGELVERTTFDPEII